MLTYLKVILGLLFSLPTMMFGPSACIISIGKPRICDKTWIWRKIKVMQDKIQILHLNLWKKVRKIMLSDEKENTYYIYTYKCDKI